MCFLPKLVLGNFLDADVDDIFLDKQIILFLNNAAGFWNKDGCDCRAEQLLACCVVGSVVISLESMFYRNAARSQEVFDVFVCRKDVTWVNQDNHEEEKEIQIYKYVKMCDARDGSRRNRKIVVTKLGNVFMETLSSLM